MQTPRTDMLDAGSALERLHEEILRRFEQDVAGTLASVPSDELRDNFPDLLEALVRSLRGQPTTRSIDAIADAHVATRVDESIDLERIAVEYRLLRRAIATVLRDHGVSLGDPARSVLDDLLDGSLAAVIRRYVVVRERTLRAMDRVASAALETHEVEPFLGRLLSVLLDTAGSVDTAAILLREGDVLTLRAAAGLETEVGRFSVRVGQGFAGTVAARRQPMLVTNAAHDPLVLSPVVRARGVRALYGVPLLQGDRLVGVATMGSCTAWDFAEADKVLFRSFAQHATALIAQTQALERETAARASSEQARRRLSLLARVGEVFARERHWRSALEAVANLVVPEFAEGCALLVVTADGGVVPEVVAHARPAQREAFEKLFSAGTRTPVHPPEGSRLHEVLVSGRSVLLGEDDLRRAVSGASSPELRGLLEVLRPGSGLLVPMVAYGRVNGVMVVLGGERPLDDLDREAADEMGRTAGLALSNARLNEERERRVTWVEQLVRQIPVGVAVVNADGALVLQNDLAGRLLGLERLDSRSPTDFVQFGGRHGDGRPYAAEDYPIARSLQTGEVVTGEVMRYVRPDGSQIWLHLNSSPLFDAEGRIAGAITTYDDWTARRESEDELRRALEFGERVVSIIGHDLRTPLSAISLSAGMLLRSGELSGKNSRAAGRIASSAERMARMIQDLLDYARSRHGGIPVTRQPVRLVALVRHVIEELQVTNPTREVRLLPSSDVEGQWDSDRLTQLLTNLLGNAVTYSPEGTPVEVRVARDGADVTLEVHNLGAPIPAEALPNLFEPFRRGTSAGGGRTGGGLGLGLFIVREIARGHGGAVSVTSTVEEGTRFVVRLPLGATTARG